MVARWYFDEEPSGLSVALNLYWDANCEPAADLVTPDALAQLMAAAEINAIGMDVPSALAAGVLLSAREGLGLRISGDRSAWSQRWGILDSVDA